MPPKKKQRVEADPGPAKKTWPDVEWQWLDEDGAWKGYSAADQALLEAAWKAQGPSGCFTTKDMSFSVSNAVTFDFANGTQRNDDTQKVRRCRRLTSGVWEFLDDDGGFVAFYDDDNTLIEGAWRALSTGSGVFRTKALSWNAGYDSPYTFQFMKCEASDLAVTATQTNEESGTVRKLRRTQPTGSAAWDTKVYGIAGVKAPAAAEMATMAQADAAASTPAGGEGVMAIDPTMFSPPEYWEPQTQPYQLFTVSPSSAEFQRVTEPLVKTLKGLKVKIHEVKRIQNENLWRFYALKRFHVALRNGGDPHENCFLFHGARLRENMNAIMEFGFDLRVARDGLAGVGIYFATNASYSNAGYVLQNPDKSKEMFVCRVSIGSSAPGTHGMKVPPPKKGKKALAGDTYDSVYRGSPPIMHVIFDNAQAYPEYLVRYTH